MTTASSASSRRWAAWAALVSLAVLWTARIGDRLLDDFYIIYTFAKHLAEGQGFVFNPGERVFGLTEPGLGLLLAAMQRLTTLPVHRLGLPLGALALLALVLVLQRDEDSRGSRWIALMAGGLALTSSFLWVNAAGAWPFVLLALALAAHLLARRPVLAGAIAGAAVWLRPDAIVGVALLGLLALVEIRRIPWRFGIAAAFVVTLGLGGAWLYFGHPLPNTLGAKLAAAAGDDASTAGIAGFWPRAAPLFARHLGPAWPALVALGTLGAALGWRRAGLALRTLLAFAAALALAYPLLGVPFCSWYAAPPLFGAFVGTALLLRQAFEFLCPRISRPAAAALVALLALAPLVSLGWASSRFYRVFQGYPHLKTYRQAAVWLQANTPPETRVTYVEIGVLGYFSERPIRDLMGLVSPDVLPFLRHADYRGAFLADPTEIVLYHSRGRLGPVVETKWFLDAYGVAAWIRDESERAGSGLTIYRRRPGTELPRGPIRRESTP